MGQLIGDAFRFARSGLNTNLLGWRGSDKFALSWAINKINVTTVVVFCFVFFFFKTADVIPVSHARLKSHP